MADGMHVDPEALRKRSPKFADASERLAKAFETLQAVRDAEGECWGSDEPGAKFAEQYTKAAEDADKLDEHLVKTLKDTRTGLDKSADQWQSDDEGSAENINVAGGGQ